MTIGSLITDKMNYIGKIVSMEDNDVKVEAFSVFDNELSLDILHGSVDCLSSFEPIEERIYLKADELYIKTKEQVLTLVRDAKYSPLQIKPGKGVYRAVVHGHVMNLMLIKEVTPTVFGAETVTIYENTIIINAQEEDKEFEKETVEAGIDPKTVEKILKIVKMSIAAMQSLVTGAEN